MNYQLELDKIINKINSSQSKNLPKLIHSCCTPYKCLEYLSNYFAITIFYYNPNIYPEDEYRRRVKEQEDLIRL